jgi:hypothetical protein
LAPRLLPLPRRNVVLPAKTSRNCRAPTGRRITMSQTYISVHTRERCRPGCRGFRARPRGRRPRPPAAPRPPGPRPPIEQHPPPGGRVPPPRRAEEIVSWLAITRSSSRRRAETRADLEASSPPAS